MSPKTETVKRRERVMIVDHRLRGLENVEVAADEALAVIVSVAAFTVAVVTVW